MDKVLITGINSFTGMHLSSFLEASGFKVYGTSSSFSDLDNQNKCDITNKKEIVRVLDKVRPNYIIHLAAISFVAHGLSDDFYRVNTIGAINLLEAVSELGIFPEKIVLASSATVYGNQGKEILDESLCPKPANHYGASKYAMETLASNYFKKLPILITRPFNYTGVGQAENFLIPKIVKHYKLNKKSIELGNLDVTREFNDIDFVCEAYRRLLGTSSVSEVVNIASNRGIKLLDVISMMNEISGYNIDVVVNPEFVRKDEIRSLTGSNRKLFSMIGSIQQKPFIETLKVMYEA